MSNLKKLLYVGASAALVLWSMGSVLPVSAVAISDGDLVKTAASSAVYYIQGSTKRVFPHANVFYSWYSDFSSVKVATASDLAAYSDGNSMPFRDGSLFRGTSTGLGGYAKEAVYYVQGATLRPVKSSEIYQALFNDANWAKVTWVPDDLLDKFNYPVGTLVESSASHPDGCLVKYTDTTQKYLISGGKKRAISDAAITANNYRVGDVLTIAASEVYADGDAITAKETALVTPGWTAGVVGALTASVADDTPIASNIPLTAQNIPYTKIKLQTGNAAVTISSITVKRTGLGAATDFGKIGLFENDVQIGQYKTLSSSTDTLTFSFGTPVSLIANSIKYYTIKANGGVAGHVNKLGVTAISSSATVSGLPVYGNSMTATSITIGGVGAAHASLNTVTPKIGADAAELAILRLTATATEDVEFESVKFRNTGTARSSDFANVGIYYSAEKKGDCTWSVDYLSCVLTTPFTIKKSEMKEFKVLGDIEDGYNRTITLDLEEIYDISAVGKSYGFSVVVADSFTAQGATIAAGAVTINFNGPVAADITQTQKDIVMANLEITSNSENAELRTFYVAIKVNAVIGDNSISANYIENIELYDADTGGITDGTAVSSGTYDHYWKFQPYITLTKGVKKTFQIRLDTPEDKPVTLTTLAAYLAAADITLRGSTSNQDITDISPSTIDGKLMTVKAPGLTVTPVSLVAETIVAGTKGVPLYKAVLEGSGEAVKVSSIKFTAHTTNYFTDANIDHLYLYKVAGTTETLIKGMTESEFSGTTATFSGLNLAVPTGSSNVVNIVLKVDVASGVTGSLGVEITSGTDDIVVEDADGDAVVEAPTANFAGINGRTVIISGAGTITMDMDTVASEVSRDRFVLANTTSDWLGRIKLDASNEDVKITKLVLTNATSTYSGGDPSDSVVQIDLYKADKTTKVGTAYWTEGSSTITFDPLNYVVDDVGIDYLYIKAVLRKIGIGSDDAADSKDEISLKVHASSSTCYGVSTGTGVDETVAGTYTKSTIIGAARPASLENTLADGTLSQGTNRIIAKFKVTANSTTNADSTGDIAKLYLKQLKITFSGNVSATAVTIQRENGVDTAGTISANDVVSTTQTVAVNTLLTTDFKISSGESATYIIKATISGFAAGQNYIQTKIDGLNTVATAAIKWDDTYGIDYTYLLQDYTYVDGALLTAIIGS